MKPIFSLDLGTTKFCLACFKQNLNQEEETPFLDMVTLPAQGMRRGMISNWSEVEKVLNQLIELSEKQFGTDIHDIVVGIAGNHLKSFIVSKSFDINGKTILESDLICFNQKTFDSYDSPNRYLLHNTPISFRVDERTCDYPVGFAGHQLHIEYLMIDCDKNYVLDLIRLCNQIGLKVKNVYAEPYASAQVALSSEQKQRGCALVDIGGGTTDGIIYQDGKPKKIFSLDLGGNHFTNDLAIGLKIPFHEAEHLKTSLKLNHLTRSEILDLDKNLKKLSHQIEEHVDLTWIMKIILSRTIEWMELLKKSFFPYENSLGAGLLITGGGSHLYKLDKQLTHFFHAPTEKIQPKLQQYSPSKKFDPKYATILGLIYFEMEKNLHHAILSQNSGLMKRLSSVINWVKEISSN